jgi:hypothetical protein
MCVICFHSILDVPGGGNHCDAESVKTSAVVHYPADNGFIAERHTAPVYGAKMVLWVHSSGSSRLSNWANKRRLVQPNSHARHLGRPAVSLDEATHEANDERGTDEYRRR